MGGATEARVTSRSRSKETRLPCGLWDAPPFWFALPAAAPLNANVAIVAPSKGQDLDSRLTAQSCDANSGRTVAPHALLAMPRAARRATQCRPDSTPNWCLTHAFLSARLQNEKLHRPAVP